MAVGGSRVPELDAWQGKAFWPQSGCARVGSQGREQPSPIRTRSGWAGPDPAVQAMAWVSWIQPSGASPAPCAKFSNLWGSLWPDLA